MEATDVISELKDESKSGGENSEAFHSPQDKDSKKDIFAAKKNDQNKEDKELLAIADVPKKKDRTSRRSASLDAIAFTPATENSFRSSPLTTSGALLSSLKKGSVSPSVLKRNFIGNRTASQELLTPMSSLSTKEVDLTEQETVRHNIINELITSESEYVSSMDLVVEIFINPLKENKLISDIDIEILFSNLEIIVKVNKQIVKDLERRMRQSQKIQVVGDIFCKLADFFKMYRTYCASQNESTARLKKLKKKEAFNEFLMQCKQDPRCNKLMLEDFLIKPIQRLTKYPLFFGELVRNTSQEHPDYLKLVEAQQRLQSVVRYINDAKKEYEIRQAMKKIQASVEGLEDILSTPRSLIKEGILSVGLFENQVYLFTDILVVAKKKVIASGGYTHSLKVTIPLKQCLVVPEKARSFFIKYKTDSYHFVAPDDMTGQSWLSEINSVIKMQKARVMSLDVV